MDTPLDSNTDTPWKSEITSGRTRQCGYHFSISPLNIYNLVEKIQSFHGSENIEQIIMNEYSGKNQYINRRVDSLHFGSVVSILSLSQPCVMILSEVNIVL